MAILGGFRRLLERWLASSDNGRGGDHDLLTDANRYCDRFLDIRPFISVQCDDQLITRIGAILFSPVFS